MTGYSGTPLIRKLGIRPQERVIAINAPKNYEKLLGDLPEGASVVDRITSNANFIHLFVGRRANLEKELPRLRNKLANTGALWVSWPKKSSGVPTERDGGCDSRSCAAPRSSRYESLRGRRNLVRIEIDDPANESKITK